MGELTRYRIKSEEGSEAGARLQALRRFVLRGGPGARAVPARYIRRILVLRHGDAIPVGHDPPHADTLALPADELTRLVNEEKLSIDCSGLEDVAVLVAEPDLSDMEQVSDRAARRDLLSREYHARLDIAFDRAATGNAGFWQPLRDALDTDAMAEARHVLHSEARLLRPEDESEVLRELAATLQTWRLFAPMLIPLWFPAINAETVLAAIDELDVAVDLESVFGEHGAQIVTPFLDDEFAPELPAREQPRSDDGNVDDASRTRLLAASAKHAGRGNVVRAILLRQRALIQTLPEGESPSLADESSSQLDILCGRLQRAVGDRGPKLGEWHDALAPLAARTGSGTWPEAAKLLYDLQRACLDFERPAWRFAPVDKVASGFRRPAWQLLDHQVPARLHSHLRVAVKRVHGINPAETPLSDDQRGRLADTLEHARGAVANHLRETYRPTLVQVATEAGLSPATVPEQVALGNLGEALLDRIADQGFISFGDLRDAISQSDIKMHDVRASEMIIGDALLFANRRLYHHLPGVYRPAPIYMRALQRISSLVFGTVPGRLGVRFVLLPVVAAYITLEFLAHIIHAFAGLFGGGGGHGHEDGAHAMLAAAPANAGHSHGPATGVAAGAHATDAHAHGPDLVHWWSVALVALYILALLELQAVRAWSREALGKIGTGLRIVLFNWPARALNIRWVRALFASRKVRLVLRNLVVPGLAVLVVWLVWGDPLRRAGNLAPGLVGVFAGMVILLNVPIIRLIEALAREQIDVWWKHVRYRLLPNLITAIIDLFSWLMRMFEYVVYTVDELIRFRHGEGRLSLVGKVTAGMVWAVIMWFVTFYVTLLIEPQVNPVKHFPVVTVSHKIMLPALEEITIQMALFFDFLLGNTVVEPPGGYSLSQFSAVANTLAVVNVFLLPGFFGFIAWELSSNWRLYAATRPGVLQPVKFGSHGEKMSTLLRPGFHSGPVPRHWRNIRRRATAAFRHGHRVRPAVRELEHLHHARHAVETFIIREFVALLETAAPSVPSVTAGHPKITTATVQIPFEAEGHPGDPLVLTIALRDRRLLASVEPGFAMRLSEAARAELRDALAGLLRKADVEALAATGDAPEQPLDLADLRWDTWTERWTPSTGNQRNDLAPKLKMLQG